MSDKLTVWTAAKEVSTAVGTMVNTYKTLRTVKKQESIILKEKIRAFQTIARARGWEKWHERILMKLQKHRILLISSIWMAQHLTML